MWMFVSKLTEVDDTRTDEEHVERHVRLICMLRVGSVTFPPLLMYQGDPGLFGMESCRCT